jgi:alpha-glucosidase (family GH31 glycosyl hydrolase)
MFTFGAGESNAKRLETFGLPRQPDRLARVARTTREEGFQALLVAAMYKITTHKIFIIQMKKTKEKKKNARKKEKKGTALAPLAPTEVNVLQVSRHDRYDDVFKEWFTDDIKSCVQDGRTFTFTCESDVRLRVEVISETIVRFRYNLGPVWNRDFSYAIDEKFKPKKTKIDFAEEELYYLIQTTTLTVLVNKLNAKVNIYKADGKLITQDAAGFYARTTIHKGITELSLSRKAYKKERYLGLGDKSTSLNLRGKSFENWVTDAFCYNAPFPFIILYINQKLTVFFSTTVTARDSTFVKPKRRSFPSLRPVAI